MNHTVNLIKKLSSSKRIGFLKEEMLNEERFLSIEQAHIITTSYKENEDKPIAIKRAEAFRSTCEHISIHISEKELIVGNRTKGIRAGVVSPEAGISWINNELDTLSIRPQDKFSVREEDKRSFVKKSSPIGRVRLLKTKYMQSSARS